MTPAGTSNELDVQNEWEENTHTQTHITGYGVWFDDTTTTIISNIITAAHSMALAVQLQLNPRAKPFVPTVKANKLLQHRRGKREEGEAPVSKHQTQLGRVRWASRRGEGEPNPPRETKNSGANGEKLEDRSVCTRSYINKKSICY